MAKIELNIYILLSNYENMYKTIAFATIDKMKAYREFRHYMDLVKKYPDKEYYVCLLKVDNEHFPYRIAKFNQKDGLICNEEVEAYVSYNTKEKPLSFMDVVSECTIVNDTFKNKEEYLGKINVMCDDRQVIRAIKDGGVLKLYTSTL